MDKQLEIELEGMAEMEEKVILKEEATKMEKLEMMVKMDMMAKISFQEIGLLSFFQVEDYFSHPEVNKENMGKEVFIF